MKLQFSAFNTLYFKVSLLQCNYSPFSKWVYYVLDYEKHLGFGDIPLKMIETNHSKSDTYYYNDI